MFQNDIGEQNINYFKALLLLHVCFFPFVELRFQVFQRTCVSNEIKIQIKIDSITNRHLDWICKIKVFKPISELN